MNTLKVGDKVQYTWADGEITTHEITAVKQIANGMFLYALSGRNTLVTKDNLQVIC